MSIIDTVGNVLSGGLLGGITGIIGSMASAWVNLKMQKIKNEHEIAMGKLEQNTLRLETDKAIKIEKTKTEGEVAVAEMKNLRESYKSLSKTFFDKSYMPDLPKWVRAILAIAFALLDILRGSVRPILTYFVMSLSTWIAIKTYIANPVAFVSRAGLIVNAIIYLTVTAFTWWFSDRKMEKYLLKNLH